MPFLLFLWLIGLMPRPPLLFLLFLGFLSIGVLCL